ncbi:MAG TPA: 7TM diverse intracellular signaling domain-containing protein, partial [Saprospiraceae bacterium]|nr:7TM diverse intracellular signaling domain-containing protein [Saprospiraceae bacterium]
YVPFDDLQVRYNTYLFELSNYSQKEKEFLIRVRHTRGTQFFINVATMRGFAEKHHKFDFVQGLYFGFMLLMILYNLFIYFSTKDISYIYYVLYGTFITLLNASLSGYGFEYLWPNLPYINKFQDFMGVLSCVTGIFFVTNFLNTKENAPLLHKTFLGLLILFALISVVIFSGNSMLGTILIESSSLLLIIMFFIVALNMLRRGFAQAKYFIYAWTVLLLGVIVFILKDFNFVPYNWATIHSLQIGSALEALLLSFALADKINIYKNEKDIAQQKMLLSLQENEKLILNQNIELEKKVQERTALLHKSLDDLKSAQAQLIQSEKMASLGELTAGIAHEIQNPLNFVNNFSEVSEELIEELQDDVDNNRIDGIKNLTSDLKEIINKIRYHGKRAENIVKGMLQHGRATSEEKIPTDINALVDEYTRLAYHGIRAKDKSFNTELLTEFQPNLPKINLVPQDFSRVIINLLSNAFFAVHERSKKETISFSPKVIITTKHLNNFLYITVSDNGDGIPESIKDKIFQPFFTTKPTGQGTGLGLSIVYDIVKVHGGELRIENNEGGGAKFIIQLPLEHNSQ